VLPYLAGPGCVWLFLSQRPQVFGEIVGRAQGGGVIFPEEAAAPGHGVFVERSCRLVLAQLVQVYGKVASGDEGAGVVLAQHPAAPGQSVLAQLRAA
jgi:hypothetical protein